MRTCELAKALGISWGNCKNKILLGMPTDLEGARYYVAHSREHRSSPEKSRKLKKWHAEHKEETYTYIKSAVAGRMKWERENPQIHRKKIESIQKLAYKKTRSSHGFGKSSRGHPENVCAVDWKIQSPDGVVYSFTNLLDWCRKNEHLFCDDYGVYKLPLYRRASAGIGQLTTRSDETRSSWRGWVVIDRGELDKKKIRRKKESEASHD